MSGEINNLIPGTQRAWSTCWAPPLCMRQSWGMNIAIPSKNHRLPVDIISHAVWLSCRICLSFGDVEALLLERSLVVTNEAIHMWCCACGQPDANQLRRCPRPGDTWHHDEVFLTITGEHHYLLCFCGGPSIKRAMCWIFWYRGGGTRRPRRRSFGSFSGHDGLSGSDQCPSRQPFIEYTPGPGSAGYQPTGVANGRI